MEKKNYRRDESGFEKSWGLLWIVYGKGQEDEVKFDLSNK